MHLKLVLYTMALFTVVYYIVDYYWEKEKIRCEESGEEW